MHQLAFIYLNFFTFSHSRAWNNAQTDSQLVDWLICNFQLTDLLERFAFCISLFWISGLMKIMAEEPGGGGHGVMPHNVN